MTYSVSSPVTKEESIALAEKLKADYASVELLANEINNNEAILSKPVEYNPGRHTAFRYFWPFLIYAYLAFHAVYIVGVVICVANDDKGGAVLAFFIALAVAAGLLIFGGSHAGKKRDRINKALSDDEYLKKKRYKELAESTNGLREQLDKQLSEFGEYHQLVPFKFRTREHMERVIFLLQTDRAENFSEAVNLLDA